MLKPPSSGPPYFPSNPSLSPGSSGPRARAQLEPNQAINKNTIMMIVIIMMIMIMMIIIIIVVQLQHTIMIIRQ